MARSASIQDYAVSSRGRMVGFELVLLARIWDRVGVVTVSSVLQSSTTHAPYDESAQNLILPMDIPCHRCEAVMDGRIVVH